MINNYPYYNNNSYGYGYNGYGYPQQQQQQVNYIPLVFVSGVDSVKTYIVNPNTTVLLKDAKTNTIYEKSADAQGIYSLNVYQLNDNSKMNDENGVLTAINEKIDKLYQELEKRFPKEEIKHE